MTYHRSVRPHTGKLGDREHKVMFLYHPDVPWNVFAYFTEEMIEPGVRLGLEVTGQLGPVTKKYVNRCLMATPEQYAPLIDVLEDLGIEYRIIIDFRSR